MPTKKPTQNMFADEQEQEQEKSRKPKEQVSNFDDIPEGSNFIDLPSKGLLGYPSSVTYRDILVKDEEILASCTQDTLARTMNSALKGILNGWTHFEKMSVHDRDYLIVWIWANTYSSKKYVEVQCHNKKCEHKEMKEIDLTSIPVKDVDPNVKFPLTIPMKNDKTIDVYLNTVKDEMIVEEYLAMKGDANGRVSEFERLMMIASIDIGFDIAFDKKIKWVNENIDSKTFGYVRRYHQYYKFGASDTVEHECQKCGEVTQVAVPFQITDILFPQLPDDFEKLL